jgi:hypothetical protein
MIITPITSAAVGIAIAFSPAAHMLGFAGLPIAYFFILLGMIGVYLALIEAAKSRFYRAGHQPIRGQRTNAERHEHRVQRRAARFTHHIAPSTANRARLRKVRR